MRSFILLASFALVAVHLTQVFCDSSEEQSSSAEDIALEETSEEIAKLAKENGVNVETMKNRLTLVAKIKKLAVWNYFNAIEQERLRTAIIKDSPVPNFWQSIPTYEDIINPKKADVLQKLINKPVLRKAMMSALPPLYNERLVDRAMVFSWWPTLQDCQKKTITRYIIRGENVPKDFSSWAEAVARFKLGKWVDENRDAVLSKEC